MTMYQPGPSVSRRTVLTGLGASGIGLALAAVVRPAAAQDSNVDMASHPIVGAWLVAPREASGGFDTASFSADGTLVQGFAASAAGQQGVTFSGPGIGTWEPTGPRTIAFTAVIPNSDAAGTNLGTVTLDGHLEVSEDGQTFIDNSPESTVTIRDKSGAVVGQFPALVNGATANGTRMRVKAPGFPEGTPTVATPTA